MLKGNRAGLLTFGQDQICEKQIPGPYHCTSEYSKAIGINTKYLGDWDYIMSPRSIVIVGSLVSLPSPYFDGTDFPTIEEG